MFNKLKDILKKGFMPDGSSKKPRKVLVQYARDKKGNPIGVFIAFDKKHIGWSKCCKKDKWNRELGKKIATDRAYKGSRKEVPHCIRDQYNEFVERAKKYYK